MCACFTHIAVSPCELRDLSILTSKSGTAIPARRYFMHATVPVQCWDAHLNYSIIAPINAFPYSRRPPTASAQIAGSGP